MPSRRKEGDNEEKPTEEDTEEVKAVVNESEAPFEVENSTTMSSHPKVGKLNLKEESEVVEKKMNEVGNLSPWKGGDVAEKEKNKVGELNLQEGGNVIEETYEGTFCGFQKSKKVTVEESIQEESPTDHLIILDKGGMEDDLLLGEQEDEESPPLDDKHTA